MPTKPRLLSTVFLIAANSVPLIGVLFYGWNAALVLALFWIENLIVGAFNVLKMLFVTITQRQLQGLFLSCFFVLHYGLFCMVHGLFLWDLLDLGPLSYRTYFPAIDAGLLELFAEGASVLLAFLDRFGQMLWVGITALILSHLVSFIEQGLVADEVRGKTLNKLMGEPYPRILVLHAGLILGAIALEKLGSPVWLLAIIVILKIVMDLKSQRQRYSAPASDLAEDDK